ncbi:helix-turn-helix domain-containing protein [Chryseobacterium luquanense]|uniref:Helix-turn-helix domain-containing protein n=1 Tax=Chryseobacterium luquanense TaxID=2983766 RepID=A0ABT3XY91_9FLAO|nr:helix-turn-helix domain-containing protein [Chryseobacterium luquanense]MCX8530847.1 helix-turn-helix domain-containing protein [Chryseobacterium luquanense]
MQTISIVTKQDLLDFKDELLKEILALLNGTKIRKEEWLKSSEVQNLLKISAGTLQNYRINGTLPFKKIGGTLYYKYHNIEKLLSGDNQ